MAAKKTGLVIVLTCLLFLNIKATTWMTIAAGNWTTGAVWQNGTAPPLTSSDTFLIRHNITITSDLYFNADAFLQIDSTGGICGHYTMTLYSGSRFIKYGTLDLDTLAIPGGYVDFYPPGGVLLTKFGFLSNGGQLSSNGNAMAVGPWFSCQFKDDTEIEKFSASSLNIYPNPAQQNIEIETNTTQKQTLQLFDINGKLVLTQTFSSKTNIDVSMLANGMYYIKNNAGFNQKLIIAK